MKKIIITITLLMVSLHLLYAQVDCYDDIQVGGFHVIGLKSDNSVWGWGASNGGQLGNSITNNPTPIQISSTNNAKIYAGGYNTFVIKNNGTLWGTGYNNYGQLGTGNTTTLTALQQIGTANNWQKIAPSIYFTIGLKTDGTIWGAGLNDDYVLGTNTSIYENQLTFMQIGNDTDWEDISLSIVATCIAKKSDGTLWGWGSNVGFVFASSSTTSSPTPIQIGTDTDWATYSMRVNHILALKTNGTLWAWGQGTYGQLGDGTTNVHSYSSMVQIGTDTWKQVSAGFNVSFGIKSDGSLWAWGNNQNSGLGIETENDNVLIPTQIGTNNDWNTISCNSGGTLDLVVFATKNDGSVYTWGASNSNTYGQYGNGTYGNNTNFTTPTLNSNICATMSLDTPVLTKEDFTVYPNPVKSVLNIKNTSGLQISDIEIYSIEGKKVLSVSNPANSIDVSMLVKGSYIVRLQTSQGAETIKIIKFEYKKL